MMGSTRGGMADQQIPKRWKDREISPERTKVWVEPPEKKLVQKKVAVVYYLTRNGQLQQPHFMEIPLSSSRGLYLKDVINRLNVLRGEGMASMYSWSCKRGYGNGFVWQDLTEDDFIYPTNGHEYVLKGSELHFLLEGPQILNPASETGSSTSSRSSEILDSSKEAESPAVRSRRRNQSCSSVDLYEYKIYKTSASGMSAGHSNAADASTQTDEERRLRKHIVGEHDDDDEKEQVEVKIEEEQTCENPSPETLQTPPSDSSPETLQTLMKADKQLMLKTGSLNGNGQDQTAVNNLNSRMKASTVLMQLLSCGSFPFKDCGASAVKDHGISLVSSYKSTKLPRAEKQSSSTRLKKLEEKEYFSGSLIQTKRECDGDDDDESVKLKRSFSCNADNRKSRMGLAEVEEACIKAQVTIADGNKKSTPY